jgi:hypothetical protein
VNGTIAITWNGSVTSASGDNIVFANSVENTTIAGTDWNSPGRAARRATSTSVHGLSGALGAELEPALTSSTAGRFSGLKLRKARQAMQNLGNGKGGSGHLVAGRENDTIEAERALVALLLHLRTWSSTAR